MALSTFSQFFFGFEITSDNQNLNFDEGGGELTAILAIGTHTMDSIQAIIKTALDAAGGQTYTVSANRTTRLFTISAASGFDLLVSSGTQIGTGPFTLLGFTGSDTGSATSQTSNTEAGSIYSPQFLLQDYTPSDNLQERVDPSVHESSSGKIETVSYGTRSFIEMSIKFINDFNESNGPIKGNSSGVANARSFFQNIIGKVSFEFMANENAPGTFEKVLLESLPGNQDGTGYKMVEMTGQNLPGYFEINNIKLRVVT